MGMARTAAKAGFAMALLAALAGTAAAADDGALRREIEAADAALFAAVFDRCDPQAVAAMVTDDFEFFHDKWGQIAKTKADFVKAIAGGCERQRQGTDFHARRRLVPGTLAVFPMKSYGALEMGEHEFFRVEKDGSLKPTEYARFAQLWRQQGGQWLLARVISYDHVDGPRPAAKAP